MPLHITSFAALAINMWLINTTHRVRTTASSFEWQVDKPVLIVSCYDWHPARLDETPSTDCSTLK